MFPEARWVTRYSARGYPFRILESVVPRLPDSWLDSVVYLYSSEAEAEDGIQIGGSGFLIGLPLIDDKKRVIAHLPCVVTNKHVIHNGSKTVRLNTKDGKTDIIALDGGEWIDHPLGDDLACCAVELSHLHKHNYIPAESLGKLMEIIFGEKMTRITERASADLQKKIRSSGGGVVLTSNEHLSHSASESNDNPNHLADFTRLVDVAARKRPQGDQTRS